MSCFRQFYTRLSTLPACLPACLLIDRSCLCRQPLVPVIDAADGRWLLTRPLKLMMKPGGHGAIWKLMHDQGGWPGFRAQEVWLACEGLSLAAHEEGGLARAYVFAQMDAGACSSCLPVKGRTGFMV